MADDPLKKETPVNSQLPEASPEDTLWLVSYTETDDREMTQGQISQALQANEITAETIVWRDGMADWQAIHTLPELVLPTVRPNTRHTVMGGFKASGAGGAQPLTAHKGSPIAAPRPDRRPAVDELDSAILESVSDDGLREALAPALPEDDIASAPQEEIPTLRKSSAPAPDDDDVDVEVDDDVALESIPPDALDSIPPEALPAPHQPRSPSPAPPRRLAPADNIFDVDLAAPVVAAPTLGIPSPPEPERAGESVLAHIGDFAPPSIRVERAARPAESPPIAPQPGVQESVAPPPPAGRGKLAIVMLLLAATGGAFFFLGQMSATAPVTADTTKQSASPSGAPSTEDVPTLASATATASVSATASATASASATVGTPSTAPSATEKAAAPRKPKGNKSVPRTSGTHGKAAKKAAAKETPKKAKPEPKPIEKEDTTPAGPFNKSAASAALTQAAGRASACRKAGDPSGMAAVSVTFSTSGRAVRATVSGPPFSGTATGGCIASRMRSARIPKFTGDRVTVKKRVVIQ